MKTSNFRPLRGTRRLHSNPNSGSFQKNGFRCSLEKSSSATGSSSSCSSSRWQKRTTIIREVSSAAPQRISTRKASETSSLHSKSKSTLSINIKSTKRMLASSLGSFDSRTWHEAEWIVRFWNRQKTIPSVQYTFALLDRCIREYYYYYYRHQHPKEESLDNNNKNNNSALPTVLRTATLNFSVDNWRLCAKQLRTTAKRSAIPNPSEILEKMDRYRDYWKQYSSDVLFKSPDSLESSGLRPLTPNVYTYSMVLDALAFGQPDRGMNSIERQALQQPNGQQHSNPPDCYGNVGWTFYNTPAPQIAELVLERLMEEYKNDIHLRPSIVTFNSVIHVWARSTLPDAPEKAEALLRRIQELSNLYHGWKDLQPTNSTYGTVIHTWANSGNEQAANRAETLLEEMKSSSSPEVYPNAEIYLGVLKAWGPRSQDPKAGERASELLQEMVERHKDDVERCSSGKDIEEKGAARVLTTKPNLNCFLAVMNIFAKEGNAKRASDVLDNLQEVYEAWGHDKDLCPNTAAFNCVLRAWSRSRLPTASVQAENILKRMQDLAEITGNKDLTPNLVSYNAVLHALSRNQPTNAIEKAENILKILEGMPDDKPNLVSYNTVLHLWATSKRSDAALHAERILQRMWQLYEDQVNDFMPDVVSYNTCINAWSHSKSETAIERAERLFREMQHQYERTGNNTLLPTRVTFGSLITACAKTARFSLPAAEKAQRFLDEMVSNGIRPTFVEHNSTINAWAAVGNVDRAEGIIDRMLDDYHRGNKAAKPDTQSFSSVINALAKTRSNDPWGAAKRAESIVMRMEELGDILGDQVRPNVYSFNSVLDCYARCKGNEAAAEHAEKILEHMQSSYMGENRRVKPNVVSFTTVMNCWVNSKSMKSPQRVESLFQELRQRYNDTGDIHLKPSQYTYNAVIGSYARDTEREDALEKALGHFDDMVAQYISTGDADFKPGPMHFSVILSAFSRRGLAKEAEAFLERVLELCSTYKIGGDEELDISSSYNGLIGAYARSRAPGSALKAEEILRYMLEIDKSKGPIQAKPNVITYTTVILAWSFACSEEERKISVQRCDALLKEMITSASAGDRSVMPNQLTFGTFMEVLARSDLPDKRVRAKQILETMKDCGVSPGAFVLKMVNSLE